MENLKSNFRPSVVEAGLSFAEILRPFDGQRLLLADGVGGFFGSRKFTRPISKEEVYLIYITPRSLNFKEPVVAERVIKKAQKRRKTLGLCPMETAMNWAGKVSEEEFSFEENYHIVSEPQLDKTVRPDTPDFLKVEKTDERKLSVSGWNQTDLIELDDFLVFRDISKMSKRSNLTNL